MKQLVSHSIVPILTKILLENPTAIAHSPPSSPPFNGFEPAQMKPVLNLSQLDEESEDINELDKCFMNQLLLLLHQAREKGFS